jgi:hypothetical protein
VDLQDAGLSQLLERPLVLLRRTARPIVWTRLAVIAAALLFTIQCGSDAETPTSPTSTTTTTTTTTVAEPTTTEEFAGRLSPGGVTFYSYTVTQNGTVRLTLNSVGGAGVPATVWLGIGIGTPVAEGCSTTSTVNTPAGTAVHLTGTYAPGVYCASIFDIGNLAAPATFSMTIAYP